MVRKYGRIQNVSVMILDRATKVMQKRKEIKKGYVVIQSLITGDTAIVKRTQINGITTKYPRLKK